jgi:hypothetical protein
MNKYQVAFEAKRKRLVTALRNKDTGVILTLPRPKRHYDVFVANNISHHDKSYECGFFDPQENDFLKQGTGDGCFPLDSVRVFTV